MADVAGELAAGGDGGVGAEVHPGWTEFVQVPESGN